MVPKLDTRRRPRFEEPGSQQILFDLRVVARATDEQWVAAAGIRLGFSGLGFAWSPDGERLVFRQAESRSGSVIVIA